MANFKMHISAGGIWGGIILLVGIFSGYLGVTQSIVAGTLAVVGSALPDIDSDTAKPRRILFGILGIMIPVLLWRHIASVNSTNEDFFCYMLIAFAIFQYGFFGLFGKITVHRGIYHSIPAALITGELFFLIFAGSEMGVRLIFAIAGGGGYLVHLILDEIYSVDLTGLHIKKSFGSAMALWSDSKIATLLAYLILTTLTMACVLTV